MYLKAKGIIRYEELCHAYLTSRETYHRILSKVFPMGQSWGLHLLVRYQWMDPPSSWLGFPQEVLSNIWGTKYIFKEPRLQDQHEANQILRCHQSTSRENSSWTACKILHAARRAIQQDPEILQIEGLQKIPLVLHVKMEMSLCMEHHFWLWWYPESCSPRASRWGPTALLWASSPS